VVGDETADVGDARRAKTSRRCKGGVMSSSRKLALTLVALLVIGGVGVAPSQASDDTWITTKVRIAVMTADGGGRNAVKVDTEHGKVTLHGTVESEAVKEKAEATARAVGGVTDVRNLLQVVKESRKDSVKAADKDVKDAVEKSLKQDKNLEGIKVESVDNGLVLLDGSTRTMTEELRAIEAAYDIPGVRQAASKIETKEK
jgi:hyperosmotically inducible periplasmic protein